MWLSCDYVILLSYRYLLQRLLDVESRDIPVNKKNSKGKVTSAVVTNEKLIHKTKKPPPKLIKVVSTPPLSPLSPPPVIPKSSPKSIVNPGVKGLISTQTRDHISTSLSSDSDKDEKIVQSETKGEEGTNTTPGMMPSTLVLVLQYNKYTCMSTCTSVQ